MTEYPRTPNPFTPTFGVTPPVLVGRDDVLADFAEGLDNGVGDPNRALLVTGARGSGKTVLLNGLEDLARERGWVVVSQTTRPGMLEDMTRSRLPALAVAEFGDRRRSTLTGLNLSLFGIGIRADREVGPGAGPDRDLRQMLFGLADELERQRNGGILISLDEVHRAGAEDLRVIVQEVQHAFREGRQVALAAAGLPDAVSDLLNSDVLTFLRRAERYPMGAVDRDDVARALREPIAARGHEINDGALEVAVSGTAGYPYLIQSVGYETWRAARGHTTITVDHAEQGVEAARRRVGRLVHEPALAELSPIDKSFLAAMAVDDGPSRVGDIVARMNSSSQYVNVYRTRLLHAGVVSSPGHGMVDFTLPYLREYLRSHVASAAIAATDPDAGPGIQAVLPPGK